MIIKLYQMDRSLRHFLAAFLILCTIAVTIGLIFVFHTTEMHTSGIEERYKGTEEADDFGTAQSYPKTVFEMLLNTHNHLFGFSFIFLAVGGIFYFNSVITNRLKYFLLVEPFFSVFITFASLWGLRFIDSAFKYLVFVAGIITYLTYFFIVIVLLYELILKTSHEKNNAESGGKI